MDKKEKFLKQLTEKERVMVGDAVAHILGGATSGLDIKKLKGKVLVYRVRVGRIRIVYEQVRGRVIILKVGFKGEDTYTL